MTRSYHSNWDPPIYTSPNEPNPRSGCRIWWYLMLEMHGKSLLFFPKKIWVSKNGNSKKMSSKNRLGLVAWVIFPPKVAAHFCQFWCETSGSTSAFQASRTWWCHLLIPGFSPSFLIDPHRWQCRVSTPSTSTKCIPKAASGQAINEKMLKISPKKHLNMNQPWTLTDLKSNLNQNPPYKYSVNKKATHIT